MRSWFSHLQIVDRCLIILQVSLWILWFSLEPRGAFQVQQLCLHTGGWTQHLAGGITCLTSKNKDKKRMTLNTYLHFTYTRRHRNHKNVMKSFQTETAALTCNVLLYEPQMCNLCSVVLTSTVKPHCIPASLDYLIMQFFCFLFLLNIVKEPVIMRTWVVASVPRRSWLPSNWWVEPWWQWTVVPHSLYEKIIQFWI